MMCAGHSRYHWCGLGRSPLCESGLIVPDRRTPECADALAAFGAAFTDATCC
jgi:hypothetical protein